MNFGDHYLAIRGHLMRNLKGFLQMPFPPKLSRSGKNVVNKGPILLFDGVCNLCDSLVQFVIRHDPKAKFSFLSLQSEEGKTLLTQFHLSTDDMDTFVMIEGDRYFDRSTAGLRTLWGLGGRWRLFYIFIVVPRPIRDCVYTFIARRRYRWFGKKETCMIPTSPWIKTQKKHTIDTD